MNQLPIGVPAPDFELSTPDGHVRRLSEALRQGPAVLVFYKGSCPTSQFTLPFIQKIHATAGDGAPWTLWAISEDEPEETIAFAREYGLTFEFLIDEHPYPVSAAYGLHNVPAIFVIQADGSVSLSDFGFSKETLNRIAGFPLFTPNDGLPETRPG
jgi:peroxiredoxin